MEEPAIEESTIEDVAEARRASSGPSFVKGLLLIFGGALLGFFGCIGGLSAESIGTAILMLAAGAGVIIWGIVMVIIGIWRAFTKG